jgi:hypothetical protein
MLLTTAILVSNSFVLQSNGLYKNGDCYMDIYFHIIYLDNAYPMVTTVAEANAQFTALSIPITLV